MHEASAVNGAIASVVEGWRPDSPGGHLEIVVRDPTRATAEAVDFYARALLAELGLDGVTFRVHVKFARCELCGSLTRPSPQNPFCTRCRAPIVALEGPAIVAHGSGPGRRAPRCA